MSEGSVTRFLFEHLNIRGAIVRLEGCWQAMQQGRQYAPTIARLLGEMAAVTALIAAQLKQAGWLTFQLCGPAQSPVSRLVMDCDEQLRLRGMAQTRSVDACDLATLGVPQLLGADQGGQLMLSLDTPDARQPYQSFVPLAGDSIAQIFGHYLEQSEQQEARLFLAADETAAGCLFLQKMPGADALDADGWTRIGHLAATLKAEELLQSSPPALLQRLFPEEIHHGETHDKGVRLFEARPVVYHCPENREKIADMLRALGQQEAENILAEHGEIVIRDDICNREYRFTAQEVAELFARTTLQ
ncbi:MAG: Hsp33 family molecular chaperone HslO [Zoogloeaceae bacterium]|nr:Hsp33 family molecular chaperone HslO [Zoogloeaceae bacterium]